MTPLSQPLPALRSVRRRDRPPRAVLKDKPDGHRAVLPDWAPRQRDFNAAVTQLEAVTRLNPQLSPGHYHLGRALRGRGDIEGAKKAYQRAAELAPDAKHIRMELASLSGGKPDPALVSTWIEELKAALAKKPAARAPRRARAAYVLLEAIAEARRNTSA